MFPSSGMTDEELLALPKNGYRYEYVEGELIMSPAKIPHERIGLRLGHLIELYLEKHPIAEVYGSSAGYRMASGNLRSPDISVVRLERFPDGVEPDDFGYFAPDLAVEILSPHERRGALAKKIAEYFDNGAQLVWVIAPKARTVTVYRAPENAVTLQESETLAAEPVLPGFACAIHEIFKKRAR